ncbi:MAG TPA: hypothetical protein VM681_05040 [Candidatus Thermoplasmatota archaeon]|nr:hypothetical protein [Candidatus Thermoplasmatota archaeon]
MQGGAVSTGAPLARSCAKCGKAEGIRDWFAAEIIAGLQGFERRIRTYACFDCFSALPGPDRSAYRFRETF